MATSNIYLYEVGFKPSQNAVLDDIETYLTSLGEVGHFTNFQYIKNGLDISIKIPYPQYRNTHNNINYVKVVNSDDLSFPHYYYVTDVTWKSQDTIELSLSLDTLNTFKDSLVFNNNTQIIRQHKDRFIQGGTSNLFTRIIDKNDEGLTGLVKYNNSKRAISGTMQKWYLVYCSNQGLNVGDTNSNEAINCYLIPETSSSYSQPIRSIPFSNFINTDYYGSLIMSSNGFTVNGTTYISTSQRKYILYRTANYAGISYYDVTSGTYTNVLGSLNMDTQITFNGDTDVTNEFYYTGIGSFTDVNDNTRKILYQALIQNQYSISSTTASSVTLNSIADVNRTLSYLVKIIECPYPPIDIQPAIDDNKICIISTYELSGRRLRVLKLIDLETNFKYKIETSMPLGEFSCFLPALEERPNTPKNILYESKMYHSSIYSRIMTYDSFTLDLPLEEFSGLAQDTPGIDIYYKQSNAINSALYFDFQMNRGTWDKTEALENIMVCNRNNEYPIYNSSYLDYIRTGYNFDKKAKNLQAGQGWVNTGLNLLGSVASFGAKSRTGGISVAAGISMATNTITSLSSAIFSNIAARNQIEQKKAEAKASAASVQTSDDLNLLNGYLGNKLFSFSYIPSTNVRSKIFDLFYLTGYACEETGIPNVNSRYRFNFLQCEPGLVFEKDPKLVKYIEDIKERFRIGVTYFHRYDDFEQTKENWEVWLM